MGFVVLCGYEEESVTLFYNFSWDSGRAQPLSLTQKAEFFKTEK